MNKSCRTRKGRLWRITKRRRCWGKIYFWFHSYYSIPLKVITLSLVTTAVLKLILENEFNFIVGKGSTSSFLNLPPKPFSKNLPFPLSISYTPALIDICHPNNICISNYTHTPESYLQSHPYYPTPIYINYSVIQNRRIHLNERYILNGIYVYLSELPNPCHQYVWWRRKPLIYRCSKTLHFRAYFAWKDLERGKISVFFKLWVPTYISELLNLVAEICNS